MMIGRALLKYSKKFILFNINKKLKSRVSHQRYFQLHDFLRSKRFYFNKAM